MKIDNLIATVDYNGKQIDGPVDAVVSLGDLKAVLTSQSKGNTVKVAIAIKRIN